MIDKKEFKEKILNDEDFIKSPKFANSLAKFLSKNPEGVDNTTAARVMMMTEAEVEAIYQEAIKMLQEDMVGE